MPNEPATPTYESAEALRKNGDYQTAAKVFEQLWQKSPTPSVGWRWSYCLRKLDSFDKAEQIIREVLKKYPSDKFVVGEFGWVLYFKEIKPGLEENNLGRVLHAANEIWPYKPTELLLAKLVMAVAKAAKKRDKWDIVVDWLKRIHPDQLDKEAKEYNGKKGTSDREQWYIHYSHALIELEHFEEARRMALEGLQEFPGELFLARNAALALASSGDINGGIRELQPLLNHPRSGSYLKADLGELEFKLGHLDEAQRLLCEVVLSPQGNQYKLGYFLTLAEVALARQNPLAAAESLALAKVVRQEQDWSIPARLIQLENETKRMLKAQNLLWPDLPTDSKSLTRICAQRWKADTTAGLKRITGRIGRIDLDKKHTFIHRDDGEKPVFVLLRELPRGCQEGTKVNFALKPSFDRKKNEESFQAVDVRIVEGKQATD